MANINFKTINSSDYVSPEAINSNFKLVDPLGYDYVTSQGTQSAGGADWGFRKWKSGIAECWCYRGFNATTEQGNLHAQTTLPFSFKAAPVATVSGGVDGYNTAFASYVKTSTTSVDCYVNKSTSDSKAWWVYIHAIGRIS